MKLALGTFGPIVVQLALAMLALLVAAFAPPAQGRMLLVPLDGMPIGRPAMEAAAATPLKAGPLPGSWVVEGDRGRLSNLWDQKVLVLAAPAALCGE